MSCLGATLAIACSATLFATTADAQSVEQLKRELAAKKAHISKLEQRLRELERRPPAAAPTRVIAPVVAAPAALPRAVAPPAPPDDDDMERALERTLVREGALVLPLWTYEVTPQFSYAHWDKIQDPFIRNSYSAGVSFRMGLPWQSQVTVSLPYTYSEGRDGFPSSSGSGRRRHPAVERTVARRRLGAQISSAPWAGHRRRAWEPTLDRSRMSRVSRLG